MKYRCVTCSFVIISDGKSSRLISPRAVVMINNLRHQRDGSVPPRNHKYNDKFSDRVDCSKKITHLISRFFIFTRGLRLISRDPEISDPKHGTVTSFKRRVTINNKIIIVHWWRSFSCKTSCFSCTHAMLAISPGHSYVRVWTQGMFLLNYNLSIDI